MPDIEQTVQTDPTWAAFLSRKLENTTSEQPEWATFAEILLGIGGGGIASCLEEDMPSLLNANLSRTWNGENATLADGGLNNQCHANSVALHEQYGLSVATGWALSSDGCWRQHTWCVDENDTVIETTVLRTQYYGFILTGDALEEFCFANYF